MGMTPGEWMADASGTVHCPSGAAFVQTPGKVPDWQREANADTVAALLNHKAEIMAALEFWIDHHAILAAQAAKTVPFPLDKAA